MRQNEGDIEILENRMVVKNSYKFITNFKAKAKAASHPKKAAPKKKATPKKKTVPKKKEGCE